MNKAPTKRALAMALVMVSFTMVVAVVAIFLVQIGKPNFDPINGFFFALIWGTIMAVPCCSLVCILCWPVLKMIVSQLKPHRS